MHIFSRRPPFSEEIQHKFSIEFPLRTPASVGKVICLSFYYNTSNHRQHHSRILISRNASVGCFRKRLAAFQYGIKFTHIYSLKTLTRHVLSIDSEVLNSGVLLVMHRAVSDLKCSCDMQNLEIVLTLYPERMVGISPFCKLFTVEFVVVAVPSEVIIWFMFYVSVCNLFSSQYSLAIVSSTPNTIQVYEYV